MCQAELPAAAPVVMFWPWLGLKARKSWLLAGIWGDFWLWPDEISGQAKTNPGQGFGLALALVPKPESHGFLAWALRPKPEHHYAAAASAC
ncbi:hypothetical protein B0H10DRAFT_2076399 [Mycena sp. CBHHK59/15]|nr:hypothetical protein B0H10DRAFT_2076399 [Mycena sp. CBHHK59/15]